MLRVSHVRCGVCVCKTWFAQICTFRSGTFGVSRFCRRNWRSCGPASLHEPVLIDKNLCVGCKSCMLTCPIGAISLDPEGKAVQKCDMCIAKLKGQLPVCVTSCPTGATQLTTLDEVTTRARETSDSVPTEVFKAKQ